MNKKKQSQPSSRWVHVWAWLLACATFVLLVVGGIVTTTDSGMAFRDWLTSDGTFFLIYNWFAAEGEKFIEHGHRLLGSLAGFLAIGLVVVTLRSDPRGWVKKLSIALLAAVILQGVLGGARVAFDLRSLALVHGCTGPLFFAMTAAMVLFTSRWWWDAEPLAESPLVESKRDLLARKTFRLAVLCACLAYAQLVVGAVVRHSPDLLAESTATLFQVAVYFHLLLAIFLLGHITLLAARCLRSQLERTHGLLLLALVGVQILLGLSTWLVKYGMPLWTMQMFGELTFVNRKADLLSSSIITGHMAAGSLIFVLSSLIVLRLGRQLRVCLPCWASSEIRAAEVAR